MYNPEWSAGIITSSTELVHEIATNWDGAVSHLNAADEDFRDFLTSLNNNGVVAAGRVLSKLDSENINDVAILLMAVQWMLTGLPEQVYYKGLSLGRQALCNAANTETEEIAEWLAFLLSEDILIKYASIVFTDVDTTDDRRFYSVVSGYLQRWDAEARSVILLLDDDMRLRMQAEYRKRLPKMLAFAIELADSDAANIRQQVLERIKASFELWETECVRAIEQIASQRQQWQETCDNIREENERLRGLWEKECFDILERERLHRAKWEDACMQAKRQKEMHRARWLADCKRGEDEEKRNRGLWESERSRREQETAPLRQKGTRLQFGEQGWLVLATNEDKSLLISADIVENRAWHDKYIRADWGMSSIRDYLNGSFTEKLSETLLERIVPVDNYCDIADANFSDRFFLLSLDEARTLFNNPEGRIAKYGEEEWSWWLRTLGPGARNAAQVGAAGYINRGGSRINDNTGGVRPACWIDNRPEPMPEYEPLGIEPPEFVEIDFPVPPFTSLGLAMPDKPEEINVPAWHPEIPELSEYRSLESEIPAYIRASDAYLRLSENIDIKRREVERRLRSSEISVFTSGNQAQNLGSMVMLDGGDKSEEPV
jgi:hypothetical protein